MDQHSEWKCFSDGFAPWKSAERSSPYPLFACGFDGILMKRWKNILSPKYLNWPSFNLNLFSKNWKNPFPPATRNSPMLRFYDFSPEEKFAAEILPKNFNVEMFGLKIAPKQKRNLNILLPQIVSLPHLHNRLIVFRFTHRRILLFDKSYSFSFSFFSFWNETTMNEKTKKKKKEEKQLLNVSSFFSFVLYAIISIDGDAAVTVVAYEWNYYYTNHLRYAKPI